MGKRPGAKYAALKRLDALMADGEKRSETKAEASLRGESLFAFTMVVPLVWYQYTASRSEYPGQLGRHDPGILFSGAGSKTTAEP